MLIMTVVALFSPGDETSSSSHRPLLQVVARSHGCQVRVVGIEESKCSKESVEALVTGAIGTGSGGQVGEVPPLLRVIGAPAREIRYECRSYAANLRSIEELQGSSERGICHVRFSQLASDDDITRAQDVTKAFVALGHGVEKKRVSTSVLKRTGVEARLEYVIAPQR